MKYGIALLATFGLHLIAQGQEVSSVKHTFQAKLISTINFAEESKKNDWDSRVINLEMPAPGGSSYRSFLQEQKAIQRKKYPLRPGVSDQSGNRGNDVQPPEVGQMFEGNVYNASVPMDNSMAISDDGLLISAINSSIYLFDVNSNELLAESSLHGFVGHSLGFPSKYDPKVSFDPINNRFQIIFLYGTSPVTGHVIVAFSATSDPAGDWNVYELPSNPLDNNRWSDYPAISQNSEDLFITVNLIIPEEPWQTGFDGTIIWQINKESGYNGAEEMDMTLWTDITYGGSYIRNLNPVDGANCLDDDNMYFLSNRNFALANDTIFLVEITDLLSSGEAELNATALSSSDSYFLSPAARQAEGHTFDTNDSRVLGAVLFDNSIQFVQNCMDTTNGVTGVYHGHIQDLNGTPQVSGHIISFPGEDLDIGYPNISHIGEIGVDENTLISFVHSGPTHFAGFSCVMYDQFLDDYSERIVLKEGNNYVDVLNGVYERWGDYSGSQPVYSIPGNVWVSGSFGTEDQLNGTWIAELSTSGTFVSTEELGAPAWNTMTFPNPASELISVRFEVPESIMADIDLFDQSGRHITSLFNDRLSAGENLLSFNIAHLAAGSYFIRVSDRNGEMITEKVIVK